MDTFQAVLVIATRSNLNIQLQLNLRTTAMHGDEPIGLCREFDFILEFFGLDEDLVDAE